MYICTYVRIYEYVRMYPCAGVEMSMVIAFLPKMMAQVLTSLVALPFFVAAKSSFSLGKSSLWPRLRVVATQQPGD